MHVKLGFYSLDLLLGIFPIVASRFNLLFGLLLLRALYADS